MLITLLIDRTMLIRYQKHIGAHSGENGAQRVVLVTNDRANKEKALAEGIDAFTMKEYVHGLVGCDALVDKLAKTADDEHVEEDATENRGGGRGRFVESDYLTDRRCFL